MLLLAQVPEGVTDGECILLGDILSTAFFCADQASISTFSLVYILALDAVAAQVPEGVPDEKCIMLRVHNFSNLSFRNGC
jgi:hypothetical protein